MDKIFEDLSAALTKNKMAVYYAETKEDVVPIVKTLLRKGETIGMGGCTSAEQCGVLSFVKNGDYNFIDRNICQTNEERLNLCRAMLFADTFLTSANAVTMNGELYNVDGNSNRVSNIAFGAKQILCIVGKNKIVKDLDEAILRVKTIASPKNAERRNVQTPCRATGKCISLNKPNSSMTDGCSGESRMCCNYLVTAQQRFVNRIKVILVNEELGF